MTDNTSLIERAVRSVLQLDPFAPLGSLLGRPLAHGSKTNTNAPISCSWLVQLADLLLPLRFSVRGAVAENIRGPLPSALRPSTGGREQVGPVLSDRYAPCHRAREVCLPDFIVL